MQRDGLDRQEHMRGSTGEARIQAGGELLHGVGACFLGHMTVSCMVLTNTGGGRTKHLLELLGFLPLFCKPKIISK